MDYPSKDVYKSSDQKHETAEAKTTYKIQAKIKAHIIVILRKAISFAVFFLTDFTLNGLP